MQDKIKKFLEREKEQYLEEVEDCVISSSTPSIYINAIDSSYSYKLEKIYNYCYQKGYNNIVVYGDCEMQEEVYERYYELLDAIAAGAVDEVIFYSLEDIPDDVYELLYNCKSTGTKIELITFDENVAYQPYDMDVLEYVTYFE